MAVSKHSDAEVYIGGLNKTVRKIAEEVHQILIDEGCSSYVKTIYIGYDFGGVMVAALYGRAEFAEIALALSEEYESSILIDATHLTWPTLPVAAIVKSREDIRLFKVLARSACKGVMSGEHSVKRDSEFFAAAKRERREKGVKPKNRPIGPSDKTT